MNLGLIFPGQGVQQPKMGLDILAQYPEQLSLFNQVKETTGIDLVEMIERGDENEINDPHFSSLIVFSVSCMIYNIVEKAGVKPFAVAGYSIGQYGALYAAKVLPFNELVELVSERGLLLKKHGHASKTGMLGVIGLKAEELKPTLEKVGNSFIANYSTPTNLSVSFKLEIKDELIDAIKQLEPIKVIELPVQGGWHSEFMKGAADEFKNKLASMSNFSTPNTKYFENCTGEEVADSSIIKDRLYDHIYEPVMWYPTVKNMIEAGADGFMEVGYGDMLTKFSMLINRRKRVYPTSSVIGLESAIDGALTKKD